MGKYYAKTVTDMTLIPAVREGYCRQFDFGTDWTEVRIGMFYSPVHATTSDNTAAPTEALALSSAADRIFFGLKDSSTALPGSTGSVFVGAMTATGKTSDVGSGYINSHDGELVAGGYVGTTLVGGTTTQDMAKSMQYPDITGASAYCGFYGLKFVIADRGLGTQTITVTPCLTATVSGTDYSATALLTAISTFANPGTARTLNWFDGVPAAYAIPDCFFIRAPFYNSRLRISAHRAVRIS